MNKYNNVKMWVALDENNNQILIENAEQGKDYYCGSCGSIVRARAQNSDCVTQHFYHKEECNCNGESEIHKYWKNNLINIEEKFILPNIGEITCIDKRIEFVFNTKNGIYKPDLIIKTDNKKYEFIIFEIYHTNYKKINDYYDIWQEINFYVFEVNISSLERDKSNINNCLKILYNKERDIFVKKSKEKIKQLYKLIKKTEDNYLSSEMSDLFGHRELKKNVYTDYYKIEPILNKFYKIFKNDLKQPVRINLNILENEIKNNWWEKNTYRDFIISFNNILKELKNYV